MQDKEILTQFEAATLNPFGHREHILVAWLYLRRDGRDTGYQHIQAGLKHFALAHGADSKYHETITRFWSLLVQHCIERHPDISDFEQFLATFPIVLDQNAMLKHYSRDVLFSDVARQSWQAPDLIAMPTR